MPKNKCPFNREKILVGLTPEAMEGRNEPTSVIIQMAPNTPNNSLSHKKCYFW